MNVLQKIAPFVRIPFIRPHEPLKGGAVCLRRFLVEVLALAHIQIVAG
jgi:hypothetical protein